MERRLRHTGIEAGIGVAAPTRAPGLRSIGDVLGPLMARLAAQQFAPREPVADVIGWWRAELAEGHGSEHQRAEREAGGEDCGPEDPALADRQHRSPPHRLAEAQHQRGQREIRSGPAGRAREQHREAGDGKDGGPVDVAGHLRSPLPAR